MSLCVHVTFMYMSACVCVSGGGVTLQAGEGEGGSGGEARLALLTCCAVLRAPCLEVSSAGIGKLHASSILGSILLLLGRLPC